MNQIKAGAVLNYVIIGLNIITGLLYTPFMLRCLGQNEYGLYSLVASVIAYLTLLDFGFGSAIVRFTAKIRATGTKNDEWRLYGMFIVAYSILGLLVTIGGIILYSNVERMFGRSMTSEEISQARTMLGFMVFNLAVTFPFSVFGSIVTAYEQFVFQRVINIARILISTAVLVLVLMMGYKAVAMVVVQTVFSLLTLLLNLWYCFRKLGIKVEFHNFNLLLLKEIGIFSFWNFLGAIVDRIYWGTGQFVLGVYSGPVAVAIFSLALTLMNLYMSMSTSFNSVLLPRLTKMAAEGSDREISDVFVRTGRLQFCVLAFVLSGFIVFGRPFICFWAGDGYSQSYVIAVIFLVALLCPLVQNVGITILQARGQQKFRSICYLAIAIVSLIVQILVTRRFGAVGCAWAIAATLFVGQWLVMNIYYWKRQRLDVLAFWREIVKMGIVPALLTVMGFAVTSYIPVTSWWTLGSGIIVYMAVYIPMFYTFSLNKNERADLLVPLRLLLSRLK